MGLERWFRLKACIAPTEDELVLSHHPQQWLATACKSSSWGFEIAGLRTLKLKHIHIPTTDTLI